MLRRRIALACGNRFIGHTARRYVHARKEEAPKLLHIGTGSARASGHGSDIESRGATRKRMFQPTLRFNTRGGHELLRCRQSVPGVLAARAGEFTIDLA